MPHRIRRDRAGDWFHVMNRGVARRSMFENAVDVDYFLDRVGEAAERGWVEVHAYVLMTTHFHLLVRSPSGELARAQHHIQQRYSRYFNRSRKRDGPLVRSRYWSRPVDTVAYRRALVGYIDANPLVAAVVRDPADYPFGSCAAYVRGGGPAWLRRSWVQRHVCDVTGADFDGDRYRDVFTRGFSRAQRELVEQRMVSKIERRDPVDLLLGRGSRAVARWLRAKSLLADGTLPGVPMAARSVVATVARGHAFEGPRAREWQPRRIDWQSAATALLLRDVAGLSFDEIAAELGCGRESARRSTVHARKALVEDGAFHDRIAVATREAVRRTWEVGGK